MTHKPASLPALLICLCLFAPCSVLAQTQTAEELQQSGQSSPYMIEAYRLGMNDDVRLDGVLNEAFWNEITPASNFTQQEPDEGAAPTEKSEIYIAYNASHLYIGIKLYDGNPEGILAYQKRRNQGLGTDDRFMWILDTFNDGRNAYFFEINPAGLMGDGLLTVGQGTNLNKSWDGIWNVKVERNAEGWFGEIRIPFRTLDFDPNNSVWGINFQRTVRRKNEEIVWSGWQRNQGLFRPQNAGLLTGLEGMDQGIGLQATPYTSVTPNRTWGDNGSTEDDITYDAGFDLSYSITPGLRASVTVNTDFAEAEVDQRRVNLSRFPLVFPEQRDFFLEGSSVFSFAAASRVTPFFSRRIGLVHGEPVPIDAGARVIGRAGNTNIGFYQIRAGGSNSPTEDFTVARVKQNIWAESTIGVVYTRRATLDEDAIPVRETLGMDLELGTSRFLGDKNLQFQAFFVWHDENAIDEQSGFWDKTSRGIRLSYPNFPFSGHVSYREFGDAFNPAVGIAPRVAFRRLQPSADYTFTFPSGSIIRNYSIGLWYEHLTNLDFEPETVELTLTPVDLFFESGEEFSVDISRNFERLVAPFDILRDGSITIMPGDYYNWSFSTEVETASFRRVSAEAEYSYDGFWSGHRHVYSGSVAVRPFPGINISGDWSRSDARLPEANFTTDLFRFNGNVDLTPWTSFTTILQYDNVSELLGLYNRFRWIIRPGADLYLVHTWNWVQIENRFSPLETQGSVKVSYTYRF